MGHIRIGVIPKYPKWKEVIGLLENSETTNNQIAEQVLRNSKTILESESTKSSIGYCVWLLSQLTLSAKDDNFAKQLSSLGISVSDTSSANEFLSKTGNTASLGIRNLASQNAISNIAGLALRESLSKTIGVHSNTLFGASLPEVQQALKKYSTKKNYSDLLHTYFSSFVRRTLLFVLNKEISNHLGPSKRFANFEKINDFEISVSSFSNQTARIAKEFSGGWYSKKSWEKGEITLSDSNGFSHVVIKKIIADLELSEVQK